MSAKVEPGRHQGLAFDGGVAFRLGTLLVLVLFLTSSAPTPMYITYQQRWHFSSAALTGVFAVYSVTVIVALILLGRLSDRLGRRRVLSGGLIVVIVGLALFAAARSVGWLFAARSVQGLGVGVSATALSAQVVEVQPQRSLDLAATATSSAASFGMAIGSLGAGLFITYVVDARVLLYVVLLALIGGALVLGWALPETVASRGTGWTRWSVITHVTAEPRHVFALYASGTVATWAIGGLYLSLGPSIASQLLHSQSHIVDGLIVFELGLIGGLTAQLAHRGSREVQIGSGAAALVLGLLLVMYSVVTSSTPLFFGGSAILAAGWGLMNASTYRSLLALSDPDRRAEMLTSIYIVSYVAFSVPSVLAGIAADHIGLEVTTLIFGFCTGAVAIVAATGLVVFERRSSLSSAVCSPTCSPVSRHIDGCATPTSQEH